MKVGTLFYFPGSKDLGYILPMYPQKPFFRKYTAFNNYTNIANISNLIRCEVVTTIFQESRIT